MWKYRSKRYLLYLLGSFLLGCLFAFFSFHDTSPAILLEGVVPQEMINTIMDNPYLIYISGGLFFAGVCNVFLLGNLLISEWSISPFIFFFLAVIFPSIVIEVGILLVPVSVILFLYGWLTLRRNRRGSLKNRVSDADEIVRIYTLHHKLDKQYEQLGKQTRASVDRINLIMLLGLTAYLCVLFFTGNLFIIMALAFVGLFLYQYLLRVRANSFIPISNLLYDQCNPEACISALIYYGKRGDHYRLKNEPLIAQCLIYMDDPSLAQDVLSFYPRASMQAELTYWALMGYTYYQLADEKGLQRTLEALQNAKTGFNRLTMLLKNEEIQATANKIKLMDGDFNQCKEYYLHQLKKARLPLVQADCSYYIALISFVQKDFSLASIYFEKVLSLGNKLYFVAKARKYLDLVESMQQESSMPDLPQSTDSSSSA